MARRGLPPNAKMNFDYGSLKDQPSTVGFLGTQPIVNIDAIGRFFGACWSRIRGWLPF